MAVELDASGMAEDTEAPLEGEKFEELTRDGDEAEDEMLDEPAAEPEEPPSPAPSAKGKTKMAQVRERIRKLKEKQAKQQKVLNEGHAALDDAFLELGRLVAESPLLAETTEPTTKPAAAVHWRNAPIAMLKVPPSAEKALVEGNEITTVGQLADYLEGNGTLDGLDGMTPLRAKRTQGAFDKFVESQK